MINKENHNIEFKQSWQEKNMDTICAFANTNGGSMFVGKTDAGLIKGLENAKQLMDEIPNKITSILGFSPDVRLKKEKTKEYIEIIVKPQSFAVPLRGKYYIRSGSSTHELKGAQLQNFLLQKSNQDWESLTEEDASLKDIDSNTIKRFQELSLKRFPSASKENTIGDLLEKLHLIKKGKLTKAAILLFGKYPQKFYKNAQFKIGVFSNDTELKSTDIVEGNLFQQIEKIFELLKNKYLVYYSKIEGIYRTEELEYPEAALREAIINSLVHRDYIGVFTQLRLFPDKLILWNYGELPSELTFERLRKTHQSLPRNPIIADTFYKAGLIEAWGHGTLKMMEELKKVDLPEPLYENIDGGFSLTFSKDIFTEAFLQKQGLSDRHIKAVLHTKKNNKINNQIYADITDVSERTASRDLALLVKKNIFEQVGLTGKGTEYYLRGHKRAKDAKTTSSEIENPKDAINTPKTPIKIQRGHKGAKTNLKGPNEAKSLDDQLELLKQKMSKTASGKEIKTHFNEDVFFDIYDSWLKELLKKLMTVGQKFNEFYTKPQHYIMMLHGGSATHFSKEKPDDILKKFIENTRDKNQNIHSGVKLTLALNYTTFKKVNKKRETFGCNYFLNIEFDFTEYRVFLDQFSEKEQRNSQMYFGGLLHEPLPIKVVKKLEKDLGDNLLKHITYHIQNMDIL